MEISMYVSLWSVKDLGDLLVTFPDPNKIQPWIVDLSVRVAIIRHSTTMLCSSNPYLHATWHTGSYMALSQVIGSLHKKSMRERIRTLAIKTEKLDWAETIDFCRCHRAPLHQRNIYWKLRIALIKFRKPARFLSDSNFLARARNGSK